VINQQPSLVLKVDTPKLVIKTGDIYVSNSNSAAAGITIALPVIGAVLIVAGLALIVLARRAANKVTSG